MIKRIASVLSVALLALGATVAFSPAAEARDSGWGCGGAC